MGPKAEIGTALRLTIVVYDAAVLIAADRNDRQVWADHKAQLARGPAPLVPAPVLAQVSRSPQQAQLRRLVSGCSVIPFDQADAHEAGRLLGKTRTTDVVDAAVVVTAVRTGATILTGDPDDIERLVRASGSDVTIVPV